MSLSVSFAPSGFGADSCMRIGIMLISTSANDNSAVLRGPR